LNIATLQDIDLSEVVSSKLWGNHTPKFHPADVKAVLQLTSNNEFRSNIGNTFCTTVALGMDERMDEFRKLWDAKEYGEL